MSICGTILSHRSLSRKVRHEEVLISGAQGDYPAAQWRKSHCNVCFQIHDNMKWHISKCHVIQFRILSFKGVLFLWIKMKPEECVVNINIKCATGSCHSKSLDHVLASYSQEVKYGPLLIFINEVLLEQSLVYTEQPLVYMLSMTAFVFWGLNGVNETEAIWFSKSKKLFLLVIAKKCRP
jgi:hypothetical protein